MNQITFIYQGLTISYNPDGPRDLPSLLEEARRVRAAIDDAERTPAGPGRNPQPTGRPKDPAEAEERFYARYGAVVGGRSWQAVQRYLGHLLPRPRSVEDWIAAAEEVRDRARAAA